MAKITKYQKKFIPREGYNLRDVAFELIDNTDFLKYLQYMKGKSITLSMEPTALKSEKDQMYAYYQKVILSVAIAFFLDQGWERVDKDNADDWLKKYTSQDFVINKVTGEKESFTKNKSRMTKDELRIYITQCIIFLEQNGYPVPESGEYKSELLTGMKGWKAVK